MAGDLKTLLSRLVLRQVADYVFEGDNTRPDRKRIFGGQVLAQAVEAASRCVPDDRPVHSMHAYFLRPGDTSQPVTYDVTVMRDGRSFSVRRVTATQGDRTILIASASFHRRETGPSHQVTMPAVPGPEDLVDEAVFQREMAEKYPGRIPMPSWNPFDIRPIEPRDFLNPGSGPASTACWVRAAGSLDDDPILHRALLAYVSDMYLLEASALPHGLSFWDPDFRWASLDQSLWYHADCRMDEWLLFDIDSPLTGSGRGLNRGAFFTREGRLVASVTQEALIRVADRTKQSGD